MADQVSIRVNGEKGVKTKVKKSVQGEKHLKGTTSRERGLGGIK